MARARNIKPSIFRNELLGTLDPLVTILFASLWCLADRDGKLEDRPLRIKADTFPYRENVDVNGYLTELARLGFIRRYSAGGVAVIQVVKFKQHQSPHKTERDSVLPNFDSQAIENKQEYILTDVAPLINDGLTEALPPESISLNPDSGFLNHECGSMNSDSPNPYISGHPLTAVPRAKKNAAAKKEPSQTNETWQAYAEAYEWRYKVPPVRNATVNGQLANFVKRVGAEEAPHIAAWFVSHQNRFYVEKGHSVGMLAVDAEKLRTQWATNNAATSTQALQADKTYTNFSVFDKIKRENEIERNRLNADQ